MKKISLLFIVGCLVLNGLGAGAISFDEIKAGVECTANGSVILFGDELDQSQTNTSLVEEGCVIPVGRLPESLNLSLNVSVAQSFIPSKEVLTRVELYVGRNTTTSKPFVLAIRDNLTGEDLAITSVDPDEFVNQSFSWVEFDFDDILVTIDKTYYIVSYTANITENFYAWGANNNSESYLYGCAWISLDDGDTWSNESTSSSPNSVETWVNPGGQTRDDPVTWDMCFKTYGRDNQPPNAPSIDGETSGKAGKEYEYTFNAIDPDGDNIKYFIDWGDDNTEWTDFHASGTDVKVKHTWSGKGTYNITAKAKDIYGAEGPEEILEITMPKNKAFNINLLFLRFLEQHPHMFPILRHLLGL